MVPEKKYDILVIGSGNAGIGAASALGRAGKKVGIIESGALGGVCATRGCVPKKVLVAASQVLHQIDLAEKHHIHVKGVSLDWKALIERKRDFVVNAPGEFEAHLNSIGVDIIKGAPQFTGPRTLLVGGRLYESEKFVIATGSRPRPLNVPGADLAMTSDELLEMETLPSTMLFIGAGVISLEFAHILIRAGVRVCIVEIGDRILPQADKDLACKLREETESLGIDIHTGVKLEKIEKRANYIHATFIQDGKLITKVCDHVVNGAGRVANVAGLNIEKAGVTLEAGNIPVNASLQSRHNENVYVAGDALAGAPQLSPVATQEGRIVASNILDGNRTAADYSVTPASVFTTPVLASVGMTEDQAKAGGVDVDVKFTDMTEWRSSRTHLETASFSKVLIGKSDNLIKGAHILGHGAEEIIHLFAFAMRHGVTADQLGGELYAYPTWSSDIKFMV